MPTINLNLAGDACWPDLPEVAVAGRLIDLMGDDAPPIGLALLPGGMRSGRASVSIRLDLPEGMVLVTETSLAVLESAVRAMRARCPE